MANCEWRAAAPGLKTLNLPHAPQLSMQTRQAVATQRRSLDHSSPRLHATIQRIVLQHVSLTWPFLITHYRIPHALYGTHIHLGQFIEMLRLRLCKFTPPSCYEQLCVHLNMCACVCMRVSVRKCVRIRMHVCVCV